MAQNGTPRVPLLATLAVLSLVLGVCGGGASPSTAPSGEGSQAAPSNAISSGGPNPTAAQSGTTPITGNAASAGPSSTSPSPARVLGSGGDAVALTAGEGFACALISNGSVRCWPSYSGAIFGSRHEPTVDVAVDVVGLSSGVTSIAARLGYACAVTSAGAVKCWGENRYGALGNGSTNDNKIPVNVVGLTSGVTSVDTGPLHACAIMTTGRVKCWGNNSNGELGNGSTINSSAPVDASVLTSGVTSVAAGQGFTCVLTSAGGVKCWGTNSNGELGNGSTTSSKDPVDVVGLTSGVKAITANLSYPCALTSGDGVKCWGGQRGIPVDVTGVTSGVSTIGAGSSYGLACAIMREGGARCWAVNTPTSADLKGLPSGVTAIALGGQDTACVLTNAGGVMCPKRTPNTDTTTWVAVDGLTATSAGRPTPSSTVTVGNTSAFAIGSLHSCAVTIAGGVKCWGYNRNGALGNGSTADSAAPVEVVGLASGVSAIVTGSEFSCGLTTGGGVKCWGANPDGELGTGSKANSLIPVDVSGLTSGVSAISANFGHACALNSAGGVKCWGLNQFGELGSGSTTNSSTPVAVNGLAGGVSAIAAGTNNTCVLTTAGGVKCWGYNVAGQLGNGARTNSLTPVDVSGLTSGVTAITAGYDYACALTSGGGVKCWGNNPSGQLGNGSKTFSIVPVDVSGLAGGVIAIAAGDTFTCALSTGGVKCWGSNLGDGTGVTSAVPVDVVGLPSGIKGITAGGDVACAITTSDVLKCWGKAYGTIPVDVPGL